MVERGEKPNTITSNILWHGYFLEGKFNKVAEICDFMKNKGLRVDLRNYTSLI